MDIATTLAANVKRLRNSRGLTQKTFGEATGVPYYTVISIEHKKPTSFENLERIAKAFEITPAELITEAPDGKQVFEAAIAKLTTENDFINLAPFKQAFYKTVAVALDNLHGKPLEEAYAQFKARIVHNVTRKVDLFDGDGMTLVEAKQALVQTVCETLAAGEQVSKGDAP